MKIKLQEYIREDGANPYQTWFDGLDAQAAAKVTVVKTRLELGNTSNIEWFRGIGEYKIDWGPGYRIYLAKDGEALIILFGGSTKKGSRKPPTRRLFCAMNTMRGRKFSPQSRKGRKHDADQRFQADRRCAR